VSGYVPERGDLVWLKYDSAGGHEQAGHRPAITLSRRWYNEKVGLALFCPVTTRIKGYPWEVPLPDGLKTTGVVLSDHVQSMDWRARRARFIEHVPRTETSVVLANAAKLLM